MQRAVMKSMESVLSLTTLKLSMGGRIYRHIVTSFLGILQVVAKPIIHFVVRSNGLLDPWHGGGVLESISDTIIALIIPNGAHHLDLRSPSKNDPIEVIFTRHKEMELMTKWINDHNKHNSPTSSHE